MVKVSGKIPFCFVRGSTLPITQTKSSLGKEVSGIAQQSTVSCLMDRRACAEARV